MRYDVIVAGASTAGLWAAEKLARGGKRVAVLDRRKELSPARRTLIVTPELRRLLPELPPDALLHRTGIIRLCGDRVRTDVPLEQPDLIIERAAFIRWLARRAENAGARIFLGHEFSRDFRAFSRARGVIAADGIHSTAARLAGIESPPMVPIVQAEVKLPSGWNPNVTQVWFNGHTRFFYWLIPESAERGVAGLVANRGTQPRLLLDAFLREHALEPLAYQGALVALHRPRFKPWGRIDDVPVYAIGDAAGQVKVTTVGGSVTGLRGAEAAARAILRGTAYRTELRPLKRELDVHWWIRLCLERLDKSGYDLLLRITESRLRNFLSRHNRDQMSPVFWRLVPLVLAGTATALRARRWL